MPVRWGVRSVVKVGIVALIVGVGAGTVYAATLSVKEAPRPAFGGMPSDADADGLISDSGDERLPEFIRAVGDHGIEGYVRLSDLEGPVPSSPEEALRQSDELRVVPVYAEDGVTVIDYLTESRSEVIEITAPSASETPE